MDGAFFLAHLSDPHLCPAGGFPPHVPGLAAKQRLAVAAWRRHRRFQHDPAVAAALAADVRAAAPDHVAVTGDLVHAGTPPEFAAAAAWLDALAPDRADLSLVPGNHDALAPGTWERGASLLGVPAAGFPWCRRLGPVALLGVSTAQPTLPFLAQGRAGREQTAALRRLLAETGAEGLCRVVLVHHPPLPSTGWRRAMTDRRAFAAALAGAGAELVLHGHNHRAESGRIGSALVLGAPSASTPPGPGAEAAGWHALRLSPRPGGWRIEAALRRLLPGGGFAETPLGIFEP